MSFIDRVVITNAKTVSTTSISLGLGAGETWPGELALNLRPNIASYFANQLKKGIILVAGTNGKTTTTLMIKKILESNGDRVVTNASGANLLNGIVSSFIKATDWKGDLHADIGLFEVDENSLPIVLKYITPARIIILNLFRDQLDRYGEVDVIVEKWQEALCKIPKETEVILNSDDPGVAYLAGSVAGKVTHFGLNKPAEYLRTKEHATDSTFCPQCGSRLVYEGVYYSHIGVWHCSTCGNTRPSPHVHTFPSSLPGLYNQYNTLAAVAVARSLAILEKNITTSLASFVPAFGRQEEIVVQVPTSPQGLRGASKTIKLFLSKNPTGFNASLRTVLDMGARDILLVLNDRIPDGRDVSWIWDVDFETIPSGVNVLVSGDRVYDLALRLHYADKKSHVEPNVEKALRQALHTSRGKTLFVLATYSAMLNVRKILTGRKIL